jgi:flagellar hook-length control protein FliK
MPISSLINDLVPANPGRGASASRREALKDGGQPFDKALADSNRRAEESRKRGPDQLRARDERPLAEPRLQEQDAPRDEHIRRNPESGHDDHHRAEPSERAEHSASDRGDSPPGLVKQDKAESNGKPDKVDPADAPAERACETRECAADAVAVITPQTLQVSALLAPAAVTELAVALVAESAPPATESPVVATAAAELAAVAVAQPVKAAVSTAATEAVTGIEETADMPAASGAPAIAVAVNRAALTTKASDGTPAETEAAAGDAEQAAPKSPLEAKVAAPEAAKTTAASEDAKMPAESRDSIKTTAKGEAQKAAHQATTAVRELASALDQAKAPGTTPQSGVTTLAAQAPVSDAAALARAPDPAHALARADAPVPLQAVAVEIGMRAMRGAKEFQIRLDPEDLGRIDVRLEISEAGQVQAKVIVDKVETLQLLQRDAKTLERAFDQAGLKMNPDGLQFTLRDPGQQNRNNSQNNGNDNGKPGRRTSGGKDEVIGMIDDIALRPAIYRTTAAGGLDIRI